jgi:hypothetical protein
MVVLSGFLKRTIDLSHQNQACQFAGSNESTQKAAAQGVSEPVGFHQDFHQDLPHIEFIRRRYPVEAVKCNVIDFVPNISIRFAEKINVEIIPFFRKLRPTARDDLPGRAACSELLNVFYGLRFAGTAYIR